MSGGIVRARDDSCNNAVKSRRFKFQQLLGHPHEMARFCEKLLEVLWNPTEAAALVRNAVDVVNGVAAGNLHRDNIRTQPFTDQVARRCREIVPAA